MSTMTHKDQETLYGVETPDGGIMLVSADGEGGATYLIGDGQVRHWHDEDEVVEAVEAGLVDDEEWLTTHNDWVV